MEMKHAIEYIQGLQYKLQAIGILVIKYSYIFVDNMYILVNLTMPYIQMKKQSNSFVFHCVRKGSAPDK